MYTPKRLRAFTIIELLVAVSVIGIISVLVTTNLTESRKRARDASRTEAARMYGAGMELWKTSNASYFVYLKSGGPQPTCATLAPGEGYLNCSTAANAVGYNGGGAGGITRKATHPNYEANSIADALLASGMISRIRLDPSDTSFTTIGSATVSDFILTLCKADSTPADAPKNAQEYAIFAKLERPDTTSQAIADTHCGGPKTTAGGWDTLVAQ